MAVTLTVTGFPSVAEFRGWCASSGAWFTRPSPERAIDEHPVPVVNVQLFGPADVGAKRTVNSFEPVPPSE